MSTRFASAEVKPATTAASPARRSSSRSSSSTTSITPFSPRIPSTAGGAASMRLATSFIVERTAASTGSLTRTTGAIPARCTERLAWMAPRPSDSAARARSGGSTTSQPGGTRSRSSSPLALTDLSSQAHAYAPDTPSARAKPVMLDSAIKRIPCRWRKPAGPYRRGPEVTRPRKLWLLDLRLGFLLAVLRRGRCSLRSGVDDGGGGRFGERNCAIGGRRSSELLLELTQLRDVLLVLLQVLGERMPAAAIGNKEQFLGTRRAGGRFERSAARVGDRPRRQPLDHVSVIRRRLLDFRAHDRAPERTLAADQSIDDRRIGLQLDALAQPVGEHGGDARTLVRPSCFLLDDRR